jgi:large subunit ribosomal protein L19
MKALTRVERDHIKKKVAKFSVGDTVKVHVKVMEGDKVRNQIFQGTVIGRRGGGLRETFVVRKISAGIAVERIFPLHSPTVTRIQVVRQGRVRRAQLTYMRDRKGKRARIGGLRGDTADAKAAAKAAAESAAPETAPQPETADAAEEAAETVES